jgi:ribonuclease HII
MRVIGIDEVGRGCLAGPVVAGAVLLDPKSTKALKDIYLTDSKKMTKKQRDNAYDSIIKHALAYGIGWTTHSEIDKHGLTSAVSLAMQRALQKITLQFDRVIIDGNFNYLPSVAKAVTIVKADLSELSVSAASVLAKVARDRYMEEQALQYPDYGFERHVGYGTKVHLDALKHFGPSEIHRLSVKPVAALRAVS